VTAAEQEVRELPPVRAAHVDEVREHPRNPRKITDRAVEQVAHSLRRFGWKQPLVIDGDGYLAVGHTRLRAARLLGLTHVPVIDATDLTPEEVKAYRIADNRTHDFTTWDLPELTQQLEELEADFAEVLALADWEAVTAEAQERMSGGGSGTGGVDLPDDVIDSLDGGFLLNVAFHTKEQALAAQETILSLDGAFNVRHDFA
jgi:ParB-like nuclease domain